jgi:hypothetical protein
MRADVSEQVKRIGHRKTEQKFVKVGDWACLPLRALPTTDSWGQASAPVLTESVCMCGPLPS